MLNSSRNGNLLILSSGSKVAITEIAKKAAQQYGALVFACDHNYAVPTAHIADKFQAFPSKSEKSYLKQVLDFCAHNNVRLLIPTRHSELEELNKLRKEFEAIGTTLALSTQDTLSVCLDKLNTYDFFKKYSIPTPKTSTPTNSDSLNTSLIAKRRKGSGSQDIKYPQSTEELSQLNDEWILQEIAQGSEFTINIYIDQNHDLICAIPHQRLIIESGEVAQAITKEVPSLLQHTSTIAQNLEGTWGSLNIQAFYNPTTEECQFIEINPRIGGGFPLANEAGGCFIDWLCLETFEGTRPQPLENWTRNLTMMRYREAIFTSQTPKAKN